MHHSIQQSYSLGYQDSYSPEYPSLRQVTTRSSPFLEILILRVLLYYIMPCAAAVHHCAQLLVCQAG